MNGLLEPIISMYSMIVMPLRNHNTYYYIEGVLRPLLSPSCIIIIHLTNNKGYNRHELPAQAAPLRLHQADQLPDPVLRLPHHHLQHLQQAAGQSSQRPQLPQHSRPPGQRLTVLLSTAASSPSTPLPRCQGISLHKSASDRNINTQSRVYQRMYQARLGDAGNDHRRLRAQKEDFVAADQSIKLLICRPHAVQMEQPSLWDPLSLRLSHFKYISSLTHIHIAL